MSRTNPYAFTKQGVYILASVLKSGIAVEMTKQIMRTFTKLKNLSVPYFDIIKGLESLEADNKETKALLSQVIEVMSSIQTLHEDSLCQSKKIGFVRE